MVGGIKVKKLQLLRFAYYFKFSADEMGIIDPVVIIKRMQSPNGSIFCHKGYCYGATIEIDIMG